MTPEMLEQFWTEVPECRPKRMDKDGALWTLVCDEGTCIWQSGIVEMSMPFRCDYKDLAEVAVLDWLFNREKSGRADLRFLQDDDGIWSVETRRDEVGTGPTRQAALVDLVRRIHKEKHDG